MIKLKNLQFIPVAITSLSLSIIGVSTSLRRILSPIFPYIGLTIATLLLLLILLRNILYPNTLISDFKNPTLSSTIVTFDMTLMYIASIIMPQLPILGKGLWFIGVILHFVGTSIFLGIHLGGIPLRNFDINKMVPTWFIAPVGFCLITLTGESMGLPLIAEYSWYMGLVFYVILLPIMMYRLFFGERLSDDNVPSFGIMAAPPSLILASYLAFFHNPNPYILAIFFPLSIFMTMLDYISMVRLFKVPFTPLYAAYTFPLAIGVSSELKSYDFIIQQYQHIDAMIFFILNLKLIIALMMISYVSVRLFSWIHKETLSN